jgi:hypothetical protein
LFLNSLRQGLAEVVRAVPENDLTCSNDERAWKVIADYAPKMSANTVPVATGIPRIGHQGGADV